MKVRCRNNHKWLTRFGHDKCPRCGEAPVAEPTAEEKALKNWQPPKNHRAIVTEDEEGVIAVLCARD